MRHHCICDGPGACLKYDAVVDSTALTACRRGHPPEASSPCVYLDHAHPGKVGPNGNSAYDCRIHGQCTIAGPNKMLASCEHCDDKLTKASPDFATRFVDTLRITDRRRIETDALQNMLNGGVAFLVCGGPSAKDLPLERLNERGPWSMAVNNVAGWERFIPNAFVCSDPPSKFCDGIWMDPNIAKFIPSPKFSKGRWSIRTKRAESHVVPCPKCRGGKRIKKLKGNPCPLCNGTKEHEEWFDPKLRDNGEQMRTIDAPNVWGFERRGWMVPDDTFFLLPSASWGNQDAGVKRTGEEKTVCTMLLGLRLLYYLGARRIYLVGVDFLMDPAASVTGNYSFGEVRDIDAIQSNNSHFRVINEHLCRMAGAGVFERFGLEIFNTFERSSLRAFPYVPFEESIMDAKRWLPQEPYSLEGWYKK